MRLLGRFLIWLAFLAIVSTFAWPLVRSWQDRAEVDLTNPLFEIATPSVVHELDNENWTEFELAKSTERIRLLTNANVPDELATDTETPRHYAIRYRLVKSDGTVVEESSHHMRSSITLFREPESGREFTSSFYLDPSRVPISSRSIRLQIDPDENINRIQVRTESHDPEVESIMLRVYQPEQLQNDRLDKRWQRLSYRKRKTLAEKTVYSPGLLRPNERRNLVRNRMKAVGPVGIEGVDYKQLLMYVVREHSGELVDEPVVASIPVQPSSIRSVIHIPSPGGTVTLGATSPAGADPGAEWQWVGEEPGESSSGTHQFNVDNPELALQLKPGLLLVSFDRDVILDATLDAEELQLDITPSPRQLGTWNLQPGSPVRYRLSHLDALATPVRLDFRGLLPSLVAGEATVELLDVNGQILATERIAISPTRSEFDYRPKTPETIHVTDATRRYITAGPQVRELRISGAEGLTVSAYTRLPDMVHTTQVPDDYLLSPGPEILEKRVPIWFQIRPLDPDLLRLAQRRTVVAVQTRPPRRDPEILAGRYLWESWQPRGLWKGRHIYMSRQTATPARAQAAGSVFRQIRTEATSTVTFTGSAGQSRVRPRLIWRGAPDAPFTLTVTVDGRDVLTEELFGHEGEVRLPGLATGEQTLTLSGVPESASIYMSNLRGSPGSKSWLRRLAYRTDRGLLSFVYPKKTSGIEVLTGKLHVPAAKSGRRQAVLVRVRGVRKSSAISESMTLLTRRFELAPGNTAIDFAIGSHYRAALQEGTSFFVPLAQDLPPGNYTIEVEIDGNPDGYLSLYRLVPGKHEQRKFFVELDLEDADAG